MTMTIVVSAITMSCDTSPTQSLTRDLVTTRTQQLSQSYNRPFVLTPPSGAPFPDASGHAKIDGQFLDGDHPMFGAAQGLRLEVLGLPCRCYVGGAEARESYVVYVSTTTAPSTRILTFNTSFLSNVGSELVMPIPINMPIFTETVTIEVYLETDDGLDGPSGHGTLVLRGQVSPN